MSVGKEDKVSMRTQLPTQAQTDPLLAAGLMRKRPNIKVRRFQCMVKNGRKVCRHYRRGTRTETKDARNMADHIYRHHADVAADAGCVMGERGGMA